MWQLKLFGGFKLEGADTLSGRAAQRKRQALLALLGSGPSTQISRDKIVALLWPDSDTDRARHQLASSLYDARQVLGDDAILATGDDLHLDPAIIKSDVREFEAAIEEGDYARAAALRTAPFLDGFHVAGAPEFERWVDGERDRLDRSLARALEAAANECSARGDMAGAARWLQQLATQEPYNSRIALLYMDALASSGDAAGAIRYGRTHELLMQQEFGRSADPQIAALVDKLRAQPAQTRATSKPSESNAETPQPLQVLPSRTPFRQRQLIGAAAALILVVAALTLYARTNDPADRSIAVLPFSSISAREDNTYFADGVHEDVLAYLTKIPDLKVISRTSVMSYRGAERNLREIARELGVAFVLEGSVRRDGNRVRVVAQLINARTDEHVWAETYDREVTNLFVIQDDIAQQIARRLHTDRPVVPEGETARPPTTVTEAYDEYLRARSLIYSEAVAHIDYNAAQQRLERAIQLDPKFALAYAELTRLHAGAYWTIDPSPARAEAAERALAAAFGLGPRLPETHLAAGYYQYWVRRDYPRALVELARARAQLPGSAEVLHVTGLVMRRRGQLDSAVYYLSNAAQRDPARALPYTYLAETLHRLGRFAEANRIYQQALTRAPNDAYTLRNYGEMYIAWRGEPDTLRASGERMPANALGVGGAAAARFRAAMIERDCNAASAAVRDGPATLGLQENALPRALFRAWAADCGGATQQARQFYQEAERVVEEMRIQHRPAGAVEISRAHALAGLGRYDEAVGAAKKAMNHMPFERDAFTGAYLRHEAAAVYARAGQPEAAVDLLEKNFGRPFGVWRHDLRLNPRWDPLRGNPRFQRLAGVPMN